MVVICLPITALTGTEQERVATPSMWTVQAPHCAMPQPYFVPCNPTTSRIAHKRGMSGSESRVIALPLSVKATDMKDPHIGLDHCRGVFGSETIWFGHGALDMIRLTPTRKR